MGAGGGGMNEPLQWKTPGFRRMTLPFHCQGGALLLWWSEVPNTDVDSVDWSGSVRLGPPWNQILVIPYICLLQYVLQTLPCSWSKFMSCHASPCAFGWPCVLSPLSWERDACRITWPEKAWGQALFPSDSHFVPHLFCERYQDRAQQALCRDSSVRNRGCFLS